MHRKKEYSGLLHFHWIIDFPNVVPYRYIHLFHRVSHWWCSSWWTVSLITVTEHITITTIISFSNHHQNRHHYHLVQNNIIICTIIMIICSIHIKCDVYHVKMLWWCCLIFEWLIVGCISHKCVYIYVYTIRYMYIPLYTLQYAMKLMHFFS